MTNSITHRIHSYTMTDIWREYIVEIGTEKVYTRYITVSRWGDPPAVYDFIMPLAAFGLISGTLFTFVSDESRWRVKDIQYAYTYKSKIYGVSEATDLYVELSKYANVDFRKVPDGYQITCGLGDEDELAMLESVEHSFRYGK